MRVVAPWGTGVMEDPHEVSRAGSSQLPSQGAGQLGGSWGVPGDSSSSRHWAHPWRMGQAKRGPGCQPVGQSSSVGAMARQGRTVVEQKTNFVWHRWK